MEHPEPHSDQEQRLLGVIQESRTLKRNKLNLGIFYCASAATLVMFFTVLALSGYAAGSAKHIDLLVTDATTTLTDVGEILPKITTALRIIQEICWKTNFTDDCG